MTRKSNRLKKIITEIDGLISQGVTSSDVAFSTWKNKAKSFILSIYDKNDYQYQEFDHISFWEIDYSELNGYAPSINQVEVCRKGLLIAKGQLENMLELMEDEEQDHSPDNVLIPEEITMCYKKIFIVHGHDGELKQSVARVIEKQEINAIILSEQANKGRTIIEKFEDYSDVGGAICLFTADDYGRAKTDETDNTRARQNVVLETGYFMGKLGRDHVVLLADQNIEMPSDLSGVVYTDSANWEINLLKELKGMGYTVDLNKLF